MRRSSAATIGSTIAWCGTLVGLLALAARLGVRTTLIPTADKP
ncbi:hypothetical protein ACWCOW_30815 [Streptomyces sp. NPDC001939]|nr:hypothetical protein [Streptomyces longhuiensis]